MRLTTEKFIEKAKIIRPEYDYSLVDYINTKSKVTIICQNKHNFNIRPNNLLNGQECERCAVAKRSKKRALTKEDFIQKSNNAHNYRYTYDKTEYVNWKTKVIITCPIHGDFPQTPHSHSIRKSGCPKCCHKPTYSRTEWIDMCNSKNCNPLVYIIRCFNENEEFIKIGITSNTISYRFKQKTAMPYSYEIIKEIKGSPDFVFDEEHRLHKLYKNHQYKPLIYFSGETECFNKDILNIL